MRNLTLRLVVDQAYVRDSRGVGLKATSKRLHVNTDGLSAVVLTAILVERLRRKVAKFLSHAEAQRVAEGFRQ